MTDPAAAGERLAAFFNEAWRQGDPWQLETSPYERAKYARLLELLGDRRYRRVLEIGCGAGAFSRLLTQIAREIVAIDVSPAAIARARAFPPDPAISYHVANAMEHDPAAGGPWELVVIGETIYYLGWLYPLFDLARFVRSLLESLQAGGRLLMANTHTGIHEPLAEPWLIRTYRDLLVNVGFQLEAEETFRGRKGDADLEALISLFRKP